MDKKKILLFGTALLIGFFCMLGFSYALWQLTLKQDGVNQITSSCFNVKMLNEQNSINLEKVFPVLDEVGKSYIPYEFTITNNCANYASYQVNLEVLNTTTLQNISTIKVLLNKSGEDASPSFLTDNPSIDKTLSDATNAYKLNTGYLHENESVTYELRLWLDYDTPPEEEYMSGIMKSKVSVIASYLNEQSEN